MLKGEHNMDLDKGDFQTMIEDARTRHAAVVDLIYAADNQALSLLRFYVTLAVAAVTGAAATLTSFPSAQYAVASRPIAGALLGAALALTLGTAFCFRALSGSSLSLPGREASFWLWSLRSDISREQALSAYLENLSTKTSQNNAVNFAQARALNRAKISGAVAPIIAVLAAIAGAYIPH